MENEGLPVDLLRSQDREFDRLVFGIERVFRYIEMIAVTALLASIVNEEWKIIVLGFGGAGAAGYGAIPLIQASRQLTLRLSRSARKRVDTVFIYSVIGTMMAIASCFAVVWLATLLEAALQSR